MKWFAIAIVLTSLIGAGTAFAISSQHQPNSPSPTVLRALASPVDQAMATPTSVALKG
jgi:hypothetical protein